MPALKLGVHQLIPCDAIVVRTLLCLYGDQKGCNWVYADAPPYDAMLVDGVTQDAAMLTHASQHARHVVRVTRAADGAHADALERPFSSEKLQRCLQRIEKHLMAAPAHPATPAESAASAATASASQAPHSPSQAAAGLGRDHAGPSEVPPGSLLDNTRYRLKRWPRAAILRADAGRIRMASQLSRKALNTRELIQLTGLGERACTLFMQVLRSSELLVAEAPPAAAAIAPAAATPPAASAGAPGRPTRGLIASLRRRLGL